jgi:glucuronosyltransferase
MELSRRFKDRPKTPKEEIIYWTEYVIKHKGAHHLKSAALKLTWYQYFIIDVLLYVLSVILLIFYVIYWLKKAINNQMFGFKKIK